ncbi:uncharacterized protein LOC113204062 [Frankliniella occidentalis]|uniref:Uncharacterized protein LOC113204062 n=1 Tax=Frankliniella occidentalis TaxID=133901 RepID=A0A6J1S803_FRAOC|nr:uncharacterized protein LOC113204062 [Frankliniella occidentalis]XP_052124862.1 uncharacterized protein LOC113204062 [Frankliniella occidentalis]
MRTPAALLLWVLLAAHAHAQFKSKRANNPDIPATSFSCVGRHNGYYADVETDCQVYHMCLDRQQFSYSCPNTTRFQQRMMVCDHWYQVDCPSAPLSYSANLLIGQRDRLFVEDDEHRALHEANVRTSKGLLKGLSQPAANALDGGDRFEKLPAPAVSTTRAPLAAPPPLPSSALELPFEDDEPQRGAFFQRSPTSSFAQVFQNLVQQPSSSTFAPPSSTPSSIPSSTPSSTTARPNSRSSSPSLSFTFSPPSTPTPPRFSISFSPSPSFPASGHNLQRPAPSAPSGPASSAPAPSVPSPTFAPSTSSPTTFFPTGPSPTAFSLNVPTSNSFSPSATASTFFPSGPSLNTFPSSGPSPSTFPSAPATNSFAFGAAQVRVPSRELEAPVQDFPEPDGNHLPSGPFPSSAPSPPPPTSFPSFPNTFVPSTASSPAPFEMVAQQTSSFAAPFPRSAAAVLPVPPSRELTPPLFDNGFGSSASGASAPGQSASGPSAPGQSGPEQPVTGASGAAASGPGSFPRPFSAFNSTQRFSLFAATAAPAASPSASPRVTPPSRELEAPLEESELDYNTVELKYQDTRRLFFIPTGDAGGDGGKQGLDGDNSEPAPVVVIKYPSKSTRGVSGSTTHLKSYSEEVKRRVDPACPLCHPDFVVPGTCSPCVLLR